MKRKLSFCLAAALLLALPAGCGELAVHPGSLPPLSVSRPAGTDPVLATPEPTPEATPRPTPETTPGPTPGATLEPTPGATPEPTPGTTSEPTPGTTPEPTPGTTPEPTPGTTPEPTPGTTPGLTPEPTPEPTPGTTPGTTPEPTPGTTPGPTPEPTPGTTPGSTPEPTSEPTDALPWPVYKFGVPLEKSEPVANDSFFDNAVFLGDSRTGGLEMFGGLKHGTYYWMQGMSVFRADDEGSKVFSIDGENYTLLGTLTQRSYDAVYIMIGVNELGYPVLSYEYGLSEMVDKVLAAQPEAVVYLQLMPPLNDAMCQDNGLAYYINNDNLRRFNEVIRRIAEEKKVVLLNTAEVYTGEDGQLPPELASDGCHFAYGAYTLWANYLRSHVIDRERYFYSREQA